MYAAAAKEAESGVPATVKPLTDYANELARQLLRALDGVAVPAPAAQPPVPHGIDV